MKFQKLFLLTLSTLALFGCNQSTQSGNTSTGNPLVSLIVAGSGSNATVRSTKPRSLFEMFAFPKALALPPPALYDSAMHSVTLNEFWLGIKNIELKSTETATTGESPDVQLAGPFAVDLLSSSLSPLGQLYAPADGVRRLRARLDKVDTLPTGAPSELATNSVILKSSVSGHLLTLLLADGIDYEVAGPNAVNFQTGSRLLLSIQTANLFKKIDLSAITADTTISASNRVSATNPCPLIDPSASDLYTCFQSGMKTEANAGDDSSGDGELEGGEGSVK